MKLHAVLLLPTLLSACTFSLPDLTHYFAPATLTASPLHSPTQAVAPSGTPTLTPTPSTPTYTLTPTLIGGLSTFSETSTPSATATRIQLVVGNVLTQTSYVEGFVSIILSRPEIHWGGCDPSEATITAQVNEPFRVVNVSIFLRLKNKTSDASTDWDGGTLMNNQGAGIYSYTFAAESIPNPPNYPNAWIYFQLVTTDVDGRILDRTPVFSSDLALLACA